MTWTPDIEIILNKLRIKSLLLSKYHKTSYFKYQVLLKYFRIPVILLSGINSVFNIALNNLIPIETASLLCCFMSLLVGIIGSIELFLQIQKQMDIHLNNSTKYCILANDIDKMTTLNIENRSTDGLAFLEDYQNKFNSLMQTSIITDRKINKKLMIVESNKGEFNEEDFMIMVSSSKNASRKDSRDQGTV